MPFSFNDIPNLVGKVALVTGASAGIGFVTAHQLAKKQCHVILACRSKAKTDRVIETIKTATPDAKLDFMELDLMSLKSVQTFTEAFKARNLPLHILVNNAGVMAPPFELSDDGIESQFATNHVAHMALTTRLLPILEASAPSRIVVVSSSAHTWAPSVGINFDTINDSGAYSRWTWYGQSKLANILFARELSRRLEERGVRNVYVNALHPGFIQSELMRHTNCIARFVVRPFQLSTEDATSNDIVKNDWRGKYFAPIAQLSESNVLRQDIYLAKRLWDFTEVVIEKFIGKP
ncbi:hypothetical protein AC1031_004782 [Aphanomyces cochlioides]|nr:hypothetical protein AC1031_004782 [Aphanomyces cochlioides]